MHLQRPVQVIPDNSVVRACLLIGERMLKHLQKRIGDTSIKCFVREFILEKSIENFIGLDMNF